MANATSKAQSSTTPYEDHKIKRDLSADAATYYPGTMIAVNASGYAVKCDDTSGLRFDGIMADSFRITVDSGDSAGDKKVTVEKPLFFTMKIASAAITDVGRKVYALYDNEVAYSGVSNSILVGVVEAYVNATSVLIRGYWTSTSGVNAFDGEVLTFTGATGANEIVMPDNLADALSVKEGSNSYLTFNTANAGGAFMYASVPLRFLDNAGLKLGTGDDIVFTWDGTDLDVTQALANSSIKWGVSGAGIDQVWYGDTAAADMTWDQSADSLIFGDAAKVVFGTGSDIVISWDGTDLDVTQAAPNSSIKWGVDGAGIDQVWYGDTASTSMTWDQSADSLILAGAARLVFTGTTGQGEIHLTDNLADALSVEISGSTDLMVFTTTDTAESVAVRGLRTTSTTAVAISGATTLTLADSGGIFTVSQGAAYDIDLPSPTTGPGCTYFFSLTAPAANNVTITVAGGAATFVGSVITEGQIVVATGSTLTFASGTCVLGDSVEVRSIATNLYHVRAVSSILNGIAIS